MMGFKWVSIMPLNSWLPQSHSTFDLDCGVVVFSLFFGEPGFASNPSFRNVAMSYWIPFDYEKARNSRKYLLVN